MNEEPTDQLKAFAALAANQSTNYVAFKSLADMRDYQRAVASGVEPAPRPYHNPKQVKRYFTAEQIADMIQSTDTLTVIAARHGTTKQTVSNIKRRAQGDK